MMGNEPPNLGGLRKKALAGSPEEIAKAALGPKLSEISKSLELNKLTEKFNAAARNSARKEEVMGSGSVPKPIRLKKPE